jgi:HTH-type transcriptional regulator / antitoxin HigA
MSQIHIRPIRNDADHAWALGRIEELMDAKPGTQEMDELEVRSQLVEIYEDRRWPIAMPTPVAAIKYRMEQAGLTRRDLEPYLGSSGKVSEVLSGKQPLTLKMIRALHRHLGIPAEVLLGNPDRQLDDDGIAADAEKYPLREMAAKGWFDAFGDVQGRAEEAIRWLSSKAGTSPGRFTAYCRKNDQARQNAKMDRYAFQAWCFQALARASESPIRNRYEEGSITAEVLRQVATLSVLPKGPRRAQEFLAQLGIRLVVVEHLKRTYLDGAAILMADGSPVVALTLRYDRIDNFWHSLLHELVHVKNDLGDGCEIVYDDFSIPSTGSEIERRADEEAAEALVPSGILPQRPDVLEELDTNDLLAYARRARVHPAIVAGRIRHDTGNWRKFARVVTQEEVKPYFV